jgi:hypothetical protein
MNFTLYCPLGGLNGCHDGVAGWEAGLVARGWEAFGKPCVSVAIRRSMEGRTREKLIVCIAEN